MAKGVELAQAFVTVIPSMEGAQKEIAKDFGAPLEKEAGKAGENSGNSFASTFKKILIGGAIIGAAKQLFSSVLDAYGELEQNLGGAEVVFADFAGAAIEAGADAYKSMGMSQAEYLGSLNKMGSLLKGTGFDAGKSFDLASTAMQRAADVASVMGLDTTAAMDSITGAAKGNFTMMDNLGVSMNATTLEAYALEKGMNFEWKTASNAEKTELALQMFMDRTSDFAGNFAREAEETLSGSIGMVKSSLQNLLAGFGDAEADVGELAGKLGHALVAAAKNIIPVILNTLRGIVKAIPGLIAEIAQSVTSAISDMFSGAGDSGVAGLMTSLGPLMTVTNPLKLAFEVLKPIFPLIRESLAKLVPQVSKLASTLGSALLPVAGAVTQVIGFVSEAIAQLVPVVLSIIEQILPMVTSVIEALVPVIESILDAMMPIVAWIIATLVPIIKSVLQAVVPVVNGIMSVVKAAMNIIQGVIDTVMGIISGDWGRVWDGIKAVFVGIWDAITGVLDTVWEAIKGVFSAALEYLKAIWGAAWDIVKSVFVGIWDAITGALSAAWDGIKGAFTAALDWIKNLWEETWGGIKSFFTGIWDSITNAVDSIKTAISEKFTDVIDWFKGIPQSILDALGDLGTLLWDAGASIITGLWDGLKSVWGSVKGWFSDVGGWIVDHKGPKSYDLKLLVPAGGWIMEGLERGLHSSLPSLEHTLSGITSTLGDSFAVGLDANMSPVQMVTNNLTQPVKVPPVSYTTDTGADGDSHIVELLEALVAKSGDVYLSGMRVSEATEGADQRVLGASDQLAQKGAASWVM